MKKLLDIRLIALLMVFLGPALQPALWWVPLAGTALLVAAEVKDRVWRR